MALIVITVLDSEGGVDVAVQAEPALNTADPSVQLTGAQQVALAMLRVAAGDYPVKQDRGLIHLIN